MRIARLCLAFVVGACGAAKAPCSASSCKGCCDPSSGECRFGTFEAACGAFGDACVACGTGLKCSSGRCLLPDGGMPSGTDGGTGGAGGGGGAAGGTGGGGGGGCWQVGPFIEDAQRGRSGFEIHKTRGVSPMRDALYLTTGTGMTPGTKDLSNLAPGFQEYSVWLGERCDLDPLQFEHPNETRCARLYIGVSGTFTVATRTGTFTAGRITGTLTNIHFLEWVKQPNGDHQTGTRCADLANEDFDMTYP